MLVSKVFIVSCFLLFSRGCFSQIIPSEDRNKIYYGGTVGDGIWTRGIYVFRPDYKFIFIGLNKRPFNEISRKDTILSLGSGTWSSDSHFIFVRFDSTLLNSFKSGNILYHAYSKEPFDSLSVKIEITNNDRRTRGIYAIGNSNRSFLFFTDSSKINIRIPLSVSSETLEITHPLYETELIPLLRGYNTHEIKLLLSEKNVTNQLQGIIGAFRFIKNQMTEIPDAGENIKKLLDQGMIIYPRQKSYFIYLHSLMQ